MSLSPIKNSIGAIFVPVSDMSRAAEWYGYLLGYERIDLSHSEKIGQLILENGVALLLDSHKEVVNSSQPLCFFWTEDIYRCKDFFIENNIELVTEIENIGTVSTLVFKDPDGNKLMVCQKQ